MIGLIYLEELILTKPMSHSGALFPTTITFLKNLDFRQKQVIVVMV